jgi:DNA-binding transcriptional MerR regulator
MFKVNHSLIRFWENEFDILKPKKNGKGDRLFRPEDVKNLKLIYHLLRERKYTIDGAKEFLKKSKNADSKFETIESLKNLRSFLHELKAGL